VLVDHMNDRALLTLGLLLAAAARGGPTKKLAELQGEAREFQAREPMTATLAAVLGGAAAFYLAERGRNPKVESFYDALIYSSTNISVGYSDIFARTPAGKVVGSLLMTYGPALAAGTFDPPKGAASAPETAAAEPLREIAGTLQRILAELEQRRPPRAQ
jgi:hypothetical protein